MALVLGRRLITLAASTIAAVALAAAVAGRACAVDDDSPEGAVRAFIAAANTGDREAIYELLGPETRARLAAATERSTELVGGPKRFDELDLIAIGRPGESWAPKRIERKTIDGRTVVELETVAGERTLIPVVEVDGEWRIELTDYPGEAP